MGLFSRRKENRADAAKTDSEKQAENVLVSAIFGGGSVDRGIALQVPTVSGGIDLIAGVVAGTPIKLYAEKDGKTEEVKDDERVRLINDETGDTLDANQFWRAMVRDYYLGKGGYAYINRVKGKFKSIHYVDEQQVSVIKGEDPIFKDFKIQVGGSCYEPYEFVKILRNTKDGATGVPITEESSKLIETAYQALCFENSLVRKGGNKKGFLKSQKNLTDEALDRLKAAYARLYSNNSDNVVVLNNGLEFQESSNTSVEMQLNENKITNASEFAKIFHISVDVMAGKANDQDTAALARLAAIPLMKTIECALNRDFLLEKEKGKYYWAFDTKELLKGDMKSRFEAYKVALDANFMQPDEVRFEEDLEPLGFNWIKLGLNDVLYDPETNTIYTPNTNKTAVVGEEIIEEPDDEGLQEPDDDEFEEDEESEERAKGRYIQGKNGKMNGSRPASGKKSLTNGANGGNLQSSVPTWGGKQAKEPFDYWELAEDKNSFPRNWKPTRYSKSCLTDHRERHGKGVNAKDDLDYQTKAKDFLQSPRGAHGDAFVHSNGVIGRYDYDTKEFALAYKSGTIMTFWNLRDTKSDSDCDAYWQRRKARND